MVIPARSGPIPRSVTVSAAEFPGVAPELSPDAAPSGARLQPTTVIARRVSLTL
jgi:hypothetical protein